MQDNLEMKEEALRQINDIKNHLVDKEVFFPYDYNAFHIWSVITVVITLSILPMYEKSIALGTLIVFVLLAIGFISEGVLTKKINKSYDITDCTKKQQFIMKFFLMLSLFGVLLSYVLASHHLYSLIFISWLFLISMGQFSVGFTLNQKGLEMLSQLNILMVLGALGVGIYFEVLEDNQNFIYLCQAILILGLAIFPSWFAFKMQKKDTQKAC